MSTAVMEAQDRLTNASQALHALMGLLSDGREPVQPGELACLIAPIHGEVAAALDELQHLN